MISDDEYLERIVAGIHSVTTEDADVTWNEVIDGRQFDVVVRFKLGTLRYLVLVEVKNRTRKTSASELEAFVTKTRDHNANKAVFVTAAGFQSGAITVAKRHGVDLFTVTFDEGRLHLSEKSTRILLSKKNAPKDEPPLIELGEPELVPVIESIILNYESGKKFKFPNEQSQMTYYAVKTAVENGGTINDLLEAIPIPNVALNETRCEEIPIRPKRRIYPPDSYFFPSGVLNSLGYTVKGQMLRPLRGNTIIDPGSFSSPIIYTNVLTGEEMQMTEDQLPLGGKTLEEGKFYFQTHPLNYFYCDSIDGDIAHFKLIESFQNGDLITCLASQDIKYAQYYIPVTDKKIIKRLEKRLRDFVRSRSRRQK